MLAQLAIALAVFLAGGMGGIKWQLGVQARAQLVAQQALETDKRFQNKINDQASAAQAATLAGINKDLGNAREHIAKLSGRQCLGAGTVRLLNALGAEPGAAAASGGDDRFASEADTARAIAVCRSIYAAVSGQLNQILDIEDKRHPPDE